MLGRSMLNSRALLLPVGLWAGCLGGVGGDGGTDVVDDTTDDNVDGNTDDNGGIYPTWQLEDIQPQSAAFGDVYGLEAFAGKPLVVTLLLGF